MDLFELVGTIAIKNSEANDALDETSKKGQQTQSKLSGALSSIGKGAVAVGKTVMTGLAVAGTAFAGLTYKALNLTGELEQNMGGSEAVFGEYAGKMQETAKNAFSNMGLSTSDFLATANKMGALFQGAGFSIEESSGLASDAMQRAADVASIMGIDTSAAMEAIAGAAKGNFTMMDNLGVAMNDTTLQAYALEKGINKSTSEMTNQEKIGLAMEMFMEKTAYAAGNYAKENETLAGSLSTAKAALTNFLDGSGDVDSLVSSFTNAANVIVNSLTEILPRLTSGLTEIVQGIIPLLPPLLEQLLPAIIDGATGLINGLVQAMPSIISTLMSALPALIDGITTIMYSLTSALPQIIQILIEALPELIPALVGGLTDMIVLLCTMLPQIIQPIIDNLPTIIITLVDALMQDLPRLITGAIRLVLGIVTALPQIILALVQAMPTVIASMVEGLIGAAPTLIEGFVNIWNSVNEALDTLIYGIIETVAGIWRSLMNFLSPILNSIKTAIVNAWNTIKTSVSNAITNLKTTLTNIWNNIKTTVSNVVNGIKTTVTNVWNNIKTSVSNVMTGIKTTVSNIWNGIKTSVSNAVNGIKNTVSNVFNGIKSTVSNVWNGIKTTISNTINGARDVVQNAINAIKGFFNFSWSLPSLKLPHISITGSFSLSPLSVPKFGISWYKKAMDEPLMFTEPTLFDFNPLTGSAKGAGEAGDEVMIGKNTMLTMIQQAVAAENGAVSAKLERIISLLVQFFPDMLNAMDLSFALDGRELAMAMAPAMNEELGRITVKKGRGR